MRIPNRVTDPVKIADYVEIASAFYGTDSGIVIVDPPVVVKTATGVRVMAWLPVDDKDVQAINTTGLN